MSRLSKKSRPFSSNRDLSYNEFAQNTSTEDKYQVERLSQLKK